MRTTMRGATGVMAGVLVGVLACQQPCGLEASGGGGLTVVVVDGGAKDGRLGAGAYTFTVTTDLGEVAWSCVVDAGQPDGEGCGVSETVTVEGEDGEEEATLLVGSHVVEGEFRIELMLLQKGGTTGPEEVTVRVERDGSVVGDAVLEPKYVLSRAGGDGCGQSYAVDVPPRVELREPMA